MDVFFLFLYLVVVVIVLDVGLIKLFLVFGVRGILVEV